MPDVYWKRVAALRESLLAEGLDALLVSGLANVRYLTGFSGSNALLLVGQCDLLLVTDPRYATQARLEVHAECEVRIEESNVWRGVWSLLGQRPALRAVGFEAAHLWQRDFERLQENGRRWSWRPTVGVVERLRERKDASEIECLARAARMACQALAAVLPEIRSGMTELSVAGMLERCLREVGSEAFPFPTIVASGPRSALPHARASGRPIAPGDFLLLDFGAVYEGYCADLTRTFVVGRASDEQRSLHAAVREANEAARWRVRAGMSGYQADAVAREVLAQKGLASAFGHGLGHGIGLEVHERPRLARQEESPIQEGAVVTLEPGVYIEGLGGVRIEDDVVVGSDGVQVLTDFPRELIELG
ncbi:MAG TPA: Xaa-Pro peptidase family protein [Gemmatimonadaceae bacterium]|nr:Xaa-Pro peptidase family protein [Gemmatimonadaceae bacterium]